ncbi:SDR family oxidoreductase [Curtobacterium sp. UCD-KPL2560]|uniref:SDR family oxidoreductase n=1 Tax=Curtobacterium sp. UCD-KPL2560 TaxID=1885315 RepID=UPI00082575AE|nr:SDR family oxidoreductase [Curtobacterium sp. UCD-KPL2560]
MRAVVIGGGGSGRAIERAIAARGWEVVRRSRSTGFDVLRDDVAALLDGADAVVEAAGRATTSRRVATDFSTRSTRAVGTAAARTGAHHVLLSIHGCERPAVQGYGYFAGKAAQEATAARTGSRLTVVRSTQWFEFAAQNAGRLRVGPVALVPGMTIAPVALDAVAGVLADVVTGVRAGPRVDVAGPDVTTLWALTRAVRPAGVLPVPFRIPGALGAAFRGGALLPDETAEVVGPSVAEWIAVPGRVGNRA